MIHAEGNKEKKQTHTHIRINQQTNVHTLSYKPYILLQSTQLGNNPTLQSLPRLTPTNLQTHKHTTLQPHNRTLQPCPIVNLKTYSPCILNNIICNENVKYIVFMFRIKSQL